MIVFFANSITELESIHGRIYREMFKHASLKGFSMMNILPYEMQDYRQRGKWRNGAGQSGAGSRQLRLPRPGCLSASGWYSDLLPRRTGGPLREP